MPRRVVEVVLVSDDTPGRGVLNALTAGGERRRCSLLVGETVKQQRASHMMCLVLAGV
jgi:hypothetical protein